jgi:cytochrome bd-type quinol oxidase subunit 2
VKRELGIGRLLIAIYGIFAISATARASYQLFTEFSQAPVAYLLSLFSAVVYLIATFALAQERSKLAVWAVVIELVGVLLVGALSFLVPELFAHPSVWSGFGAGYGYVPLVLPILGLVWLRSRKSA